jgi:hypothetical protein
MFLKVNKLVCVRSLVGFILFGVLMYMPFLFLSLKSHRHLGVPPLPIERTLIWQPANSTIDSIHNNVLWVRTSDQLPLEFERDLMITGCNFFTFSITNNNNQILVAAYSRIHLHVDTQVVRLFSFGLLGPTQCFVLVKNNPPPNQSQNDDGAWIVTLFAEMGFRLSFGTGLSHSWIPWFVALNSLASILGAGLLLKHLYRAAYKRLVNGLWKRQTRLLKYGYFMIEAEERNRQRQQHPQRQRQGQRKRGSSYADGEIPPVDKLLVKEYLQTEPVTIVVKEEEEEEEEKGEEEEKVDSKEQEAKHRENDDESNQVKIKISGDDADMTLSINNSIKSDSSGEESICHTQSSPVTSQPRFWMHMLAVMDHLLGIVSIIDTCRLNPPLTDSNSTKSGKKCQMHGDLFADNIIIKHHNQTNEKVIQAAKLAAIIQHRESRQTVSVSLAIFSVILEYLIVVMPVIGGWATLIFITVSWVQTLALICVLVYCGFATLATMSYYFEYQKPTILQSFFYTLLFPIACWMGTTYAIHSLLWFALGLILKPAVCIPIVVNVAVVGVYSYALYQKLVVEKRDRDRQVRQAQKENGCYELHLKEEQHHARQLFVLVSSHLLFLLVCTCFLTAGLYAFSAGNADTILSTVLLSAVPVVSVLASKISELAKTVPLEEQQRQLLLALQSLKSQLLDFNGRKMYSGFSSSSTGVLINTNDQQPRHVHFADDVEDDEATPDSYSNNILDKPLKCSRHVRLD